VVLHGTFYLHLENILVNGLHKMSRTHIHFTSRWPEDAKVISGMRADCDVVIELDAKRAMAEDPTIKFYRSQNEVILSPGSSKEDSENAIPRRFFKRVVDRASGEDILPQWVAQLEANEAAQALAQAQADA